MNDLGTFVDMESKRYKVIRERFPDSKGNYPPMWGANSTAGIIYYFNTYGLDNQAEIESKFAYSAYLTYRSV